MYHRWLPPRSKKKHAEDSTLLSETAAGKKRRLNSPHSCGPEDRSSHTHLPTPQSSLFGRSLCVEIVEIILSYLDTKSRCRTAQVCRDLRRMLYSNKSYWRTLDLSGREHRTPIRSTEKRLMGVIGFAPHIYLNVTHVNLSYSSVSDNTAICHLCGSCPELLSLSLSFCQSIDSYCIPYLQMCKNLKKLSLQGAGKMGNQAVTFLTTAAKGLEELNLANLRYLTHECLEDVVLLTELRTLDLSDSLSIDDWRPLLNFRPGSMPNLNSLALPGNEEVTDGQLGQLATSYPNLESLTIFVGDSVEFTGASLYSFLAKSSQMKRLDLAISSESAVNVALPAFHKVQNLSLDICYGIFSDNTIRNIARNAQNLTSLCFYNNPEENNAFNVSDSTLALVVEHCPRLWRLQIFCENLSTNGLRVVTGLRDLRHLDLTGPKLSNLTMKHLAANLRKLTHLIVLMPSKASRETAISNLFRGLHRVTHVVLFLDTFNDTDLQHLGVCCPNLTHLELSTYFNIPFTLEGLAEHCRNLYSLKLSQEKPPPAKIRSYKYLEAPFATLARRCRKIERLAITGSLLTDNALLSLSDLPILHTLHVENCTSMTWQGLRTFAERAGYLRDVYAVNCLQFTNEVFLSFAQMGVRLHDSEDGLVWHGI